MKFAVNVTVAVLFALPLLGWALLIYTFIQLNLVIAPSYLGLL